MLTGGTLFFKPQFCLLQECSLIPSIVPNRCAVAQWFSKINYTFSIYPNRTFIVACKIVTSTLKGGIFMSKRSPNGFPKALNAV